MSCPNTTLACENRLYDIEHDPIPSAPAELKNLDQWVTWELLPNKGKVPYQVNADGKAAVDDPSTWSTFKEASAKVPHVTANKGIGLMLGVEGCGFLILDFDGCRNPLTGEIAQWAENLVKRYPTYCEISPSGTGFKAFYRYDERPELPNGGGSWKLSVFPAMAGVTKNPALEVFTHRRYVAVTGNVGSKLPTPIADYPNFIPELEAMLPYMTPKTASVDAEITLQDPSDTELFKALAVGKWQDLRRGGTWQELRYCGGTLRFQSQSEADFNFCRMLALKHGRDAGAIDAEFRGSGLMRAKWDRPVNRKETYGEYTIRRAIEYVASHPMKTDQPSPEISIGEFALPAIKGSHRDYVLSPLQERGDGWFPRGDISLIAGPSGAGKTSFMIDLLRSQRMGVPVLGHRSNQLDFLVVMADRGYNANRRTMERMGIDEAQVPIRRLPSSLGQLALTNLKSIIETEKVLPAIVFVEGADMLVEDANKMNVVSPFLDELQKLTAHYHIALILSVGCPKTKPKDSYIAKRDNVFGTVAWGRKTETIVVMQYRDGDDTKAQREMSVLLRNGPSEKFLLAFHDGVLAQDATTELDSSNPESSIANWALKQSDPFSVEDVLQNLIGTTRSTVTRHLNKLWQESKLSRYPIGRGGKLLYKPRNKIERVYIEGEQETLDVF